MNEKYTLIGITEDFGTGKDKAGNSFDWSGYRLVVQEAGRKSAITKILKASKELDTDSIVDYLSDNGPSSVSLLFDEYGRVAAVTYGKG